ncbi:cilia- and flagella-associated protein 161-like isoform X2 [Limulus polyphemus]|uniref:Cilia- and flagella-associated protein 161-like isoform X2 n=1 Tax=Limulus polyphemus TaxID=6850 RepID=A0ABM1SIN2_LIMPO|nr:cilia- and flagella-associated protein 161-like isoform X2 [Limulus polyphemus]
MASYCSVPFGMKPSDGFTMALPSGKTSYTSAVRIGNWNEEAYLKEEKKSEFFHKKNRGELLSQKTDKLLETALSPVSLSIQCDGYLYDGNIVQLQSSFDSTLVLAATPSPPEPNTNDINTFLPSCAVSASSYNQPCTRNSFIVFRLNKSLSQELPITYGESVILQTVQHIGSLNLYSDRSFFQVMNKSRNQEVILCKGGTPSNFWRVIFPDQGWRLEKEGSPVPDCFWCRTVSKIA